MSDYITVRDGAGNLIRLAGTLDTTDPAAPKFIPDHRDPATVAALTALAAAQGGMARDTTLRDGSAHVRVDNLPTTQPVSGSVTVSNLPATQPVSGTVAVSNPVSTPDVSDRAARLLGHVTVDAAPAVTGTVAVSNLPATQPISGTVAVSNLPATQPVSGTVTVDNPATTPDVSDRAARLLGHVTVDNLPATQPVSGTVAVSNLPATQPVSGTVAISNPVSTPDVSDRAGRLLGHVTVDSHPAITGTVAVSGTVATTLSGTPAVDTELPAAAALSDAAGNPTTVIVGNVPHRWNGSALYRERGNIASVPIGVGNHIADTAGAQQTNYSTQKVQAVLTVTALPVSGSLTFVMQGYDPATGSPYDLTVFTAVTAVGTYVYEYGQRAGGVRGAVVGSQEGFIPLTWRPLVRHSSQTVTFAYSLSTNLLN